MPNRRCDMGEPKRVREPLSQRLALTESIRESGERLSLVTGDLTDGHHSFPAHRTCIFGRAR